MLWLALHFPLLPIESLPCRTSPSALLRQGRILLGDAPALAGGVRAGQTLSTALGLLPSLTVHDESAADPAACLARLACWAGQFTPTISLFPPTGLLLEISACRRLFGGLDNIVQAVRAGLAEQGHVLQVAVAPTPLGAYWLACGAQSVQAESLPELHLALATLPCALTAWRKPVLDALAACGLTELGALRALPSAALRQRIGSTAMDDLARAWGDLPDPRPLFSFPEHFSERIELPARVEHAEALGFVGQRLFGTLRGWLLARQLVLRRCSLHLEHEDGPPTCFLLAFAEATHDEGCFVRLLRERLASLVLPAPVVALRLQADEAVPVTGQSAALFAQPAAAEAALSCLARVQARLGNDAVCQLVHIAEHRPECASQYPAELLSEVHGPAQPALRAGKGGDTGFGQPLWLLPKPKRLFERDGRPQWSGPLQLMTRGERIESGWWDEGESGAQGDLRRDYFVARNPHCQMAWIFRNAEGWFLHGLFA